MSQYAKSLAACIKFCIPKETSTAEMEDQHLENKDPLKNNTQ